MKDSVGLDKKLVLSISVVSIAVNVCLSVLKAAAGIGAHSGAMISDALHSASDVFSTFIVLFGYHASRKDCDRAHPYGHERMECVAAIFLSSVLFLVGLEIGLGGIHRILDGAQGNLGAPGVAALWAAVISIGVKEGMFWYTRWGAKKVCSDALMADAWHHRSDALSSVGSFIGIFGARLGFPWLDPFASLVICFFILKAAVDILRDALRKMVDHACDDQTVCRLKQSILEESGVEGLDMIRTRLFGAKSYVDVEIAVNSALSLTCAHHIAENVHDKVEREFPEVKHCMIHVNPVGAHDGEKGELNEYESH